MTDDLISRKVLLDRIERLKMDGHTDYPKWQVRAADIMREIKAAPEVKPEYIDRPHGYWEKMKPDALIYWRCSACKKALYLEEPRGAFYCSRCGARIFGEADSDG